MSQIKSIQLLLWAILSINVCGFVGGYYLMNLRFEQQIEKFTRLQYKNYQAIRNTEEDLIQARFEIYTLGGYLDVKFFDQRVVSLAISAAHHNPLETSERSKNLFDMVNNNMKERGTWAEIYKKNQYSHKWLGEKLKAVNDAIDKQKKTILNQ